MEKEYKILLTKEELWELINNFEQGYDPDTPGNEIAVKVSEKLWKVYSGIRR